MPDASPSPAAERQRRHRDRRKHGRFVVPGYGFRIQVVFRLYVVYTIMYIRRRYRSILLCAIPRPETAMSPLTRRGKAPPASGTINLRASAEQKALIDRAAALLGTSRTDFMLESARQAAENALLDQRLFLLDEEQYATFVQWLEAPVEPGPKLRRLMAAWAPWDR